MAKEKSKAKRSEEAELAGGELQAKNIFLSKDCIKYFNMAAFEKNDKFKPYVQDLLERIAKEDLDGKIAAL